MKRYSSKGQYVLLHICAGCNSLVSYPRALAFAPESPGANCNLHAACSEASRRWIWPRLSKDEDGNPIITPIIQVAQ